MMTKNRKEKKKELDRNRDYLDPPSRRDIRKKKRMVRKKTIQKKKLERKNAKKSASIRKERALTDKKLHLKLKQQHKADVLSGRQMFLNHLILKPVILTTMGH